MIGREKRILALVKEYFTLEDLVEIKKRLIGTGFIGGKSVGMLLARNILRKDPALDWQAELEMHDSFYIGSDIFYSYMVQNGWWKLLMAQKPMKAILKSPANSKARCCTAFSRRNQGTVSAHAGIFRPGADYCPFQFAFGRCLRQRFCRKV